MELDARKGFGFEKIVVVHFVKPGADIPSDDVPLGVVHGLFFGEVALFLRGSPPRNGRATISGAFHGGIRRVGCRPHAPC